VTSRIESIHLKEAQAKGEKTYIGRTCTRCGCNVRYVINRSCRACSQERDSKRDRWNPLKHGGLPKSAAIKDTDALRVTDVDNEKFLKALLREAHGFHKNRLAQLPIRPKVDRPRKTP
jgi:hypothetical protein